jgi:hypothetical protein
MPPTARDVKRFNKDRLKRQTAEAEEFNSIMSGLEIPPAQIWSTLCVTIERVARPTHRLVSVDPGDMEREVVQLRAFMDAERNRRKHAERHIRKMELKLKRAAQSAPGPPGPPAAVGVTWAEGWAAAMPEVMGVLADVGLTEGERRDTVAKIQAIPARWPTTFSEKVKKDARPEVVDRAPAAPVPVPESFIGLQRPSSHDGDTPRPFVGGVSGTRERGASMERDASVGSNMSELSEPRSPEQPEEQSEGIDPTADPSG